jgi:GNAT superfamily N-acetyltransferase
MPFVRVQPEDMSRVTAVAGIEEAARQVDDPDAFPVIAEMLAGQLRYGWDLEPEEHYLYIPEETADPVGVLVLDKPTRDNLHLVWVQITVHPEHRRRGHGSVIMNEAVRRTRAADRNTIWVGTAEDDQGAQVRRRPRLQLRKP